MVKLVRLCLVMLAPFGVLAADDMERIPEELRLPDEAPLPDDQNAIKLLIKGVSASLEEKKMNRRALECVREGRLTDDLEALARAEKTHLLAEGLLKNPARFWVQKPPTPWLLPAAELTFAEELLARQASLKGDRVKMDTHVNCLLAWNRKLREAGPDVAGWMVASLSWKTAFNVMFQDWETGPDQEGRLDEIEARFMKSRMVSEESIHVEKMEFAEMRALGPLLEYLKSDAGELVPAFLNPPFNKATVEDLLKLPYDEKTDHAEAATRAIEAIERLRSRKPIYEWPEFAQPIPHKTLEDYRLLPNGLGRLLVEQMDPWLGTVACATPMIEEAEIETAIRWLRAERKEGGIKPDAFPISPDPMSGRPLRVDVGARLIRSVGKDMKPNDAEIVPPGIGLQRGLEDPAFRVPRWRQD